MSVVEFLEVSVAIGLGGAVGALLRWNCELLVVRYTVWPGWTGTLLANCLASLLIGLLATLHGLPAALLVGGLCGAMSTFSTFALDIALLWLQQRRLQAMTACIMTCLGGFGGVWAGMMLGGAM